MVSEVFGIGERLQRAGVGLKDAMSVIHMTLGDQGVVDGQLPQEIFEGLHESIHRTVHGTRIERFKPTESARPFHVFEIRTPEGEALGYLNMIYLRKPLPCYYLVYVEVLPSFRNRGLGTRILVAFRAFLEDKGAVGLLDNIIPSEDPTFEMYSKLGYRRIEEVIGREFANGGGHYMVWVPAVVRFPDLPEKMTKLLFNLKRKRPVIDMKDNEAMVKRTIEEFRAVHDAMVRLFDSELRAGISTPLMRFMFTKFVTKLIGFRRRIAGLLGYTGGESLEQISVAEWIRNLPIQPYSLWGPDPGRAEIRGDDAAARDLPEALRENPSGFIEALPIYRRPYLVSRFGDEGDESANDLKISDLLELGFDPTRLREWVHEGRSFIFERLSPRFLPSMERKARLLSEVAQATAGRRFWAATVRTNPPVALILHQGNLYVQRRKVEGIHSEEALDQLRTSPYLRGMNDAVGIDRAVLGVIREMKGWLRAHFGPEFREETEDLTFFIPWDMERNVPRISVDVGGVSIDTVWLA